MQIEIETTVERTAAILATELDAVVSGTYVFSDQFVRVELLHTHIHTKDSD